MPGVRKFNKHIYIKYLNNSSCRLNGSAVRGRLHKWGRWQRIVPLFQLDDFCVPLWHGAMWSSVRAFRLTHQAQKILPLRFLQARAPMTAVTCASTAAD